MIFDYSNPITGLNYQSISDTVVIVDLKGINWMEKMEDTINLWKEHQGKLGIQFINTDKPSVDEVHSPIITNQWIK